MPISGAAGEASLKRFFVFKLGDDEFAIDISIVKEVHLPLEVFPVPCAPHFILGVANLRGRAVPVIDLKERLGLRLQEREPSRMVVVEVDGCEFIFGIDSHGEDLLIQENEILQSPPNLPDEIQQYAVGVISIGERAILLLEFQPSLLR
ncbi:MAG: chemotaxis protein CheW [Armatimonadota bacterium]|nr:chemotaxis protein CheW [Armatimonadota bacterium]MCX7777435.1 chemotaxis protein CheW [Armatimonadota bacterium]MDW8025104.1 chemotaxis protein CheW [Armatimonadota bacterium]